MADTMSGVDAVALADELAAAGVAGVTIAWIDNCGISRSRTVPVARLADVAAHGVGITSLFAVFDTHDGITFAHEGLSNASGDVRLLPVLERTRRLAGQPAFAWAPGRQLAADGSAWPYDQRSALERQVERAAGLGLELRCGYELEFYVGIDGDELRPAHSGPAYSANAMLAVDEFAERLLTDMDANGLEIGQLHAEYGPSQMELSLPAIDPVSAADDQVLARQTIRAAARACGLGVSFAPLVTSEGVGNGCHVHASVWREGRNLLEGASGSGSELDAGPGPVPEGASFIAGLLRDLRAIAAITAPSVPSLTRLRPGYFASAYAFWGVENREAALRYVPSSEFLGVGHANIELKASDASSNPYLSLAVLIASGVAGIEEGLELGPAIQDDPGGWSEEERERTGVVRLASTPAEQREALLGCPRVADALGEPLIGAFVAVRDADAEWARERSDEEVVAAHLWRY